MAQPFHMLVKNTFLEVPCDAERSPRELRRCVSDSEISMPSSHNSHNSSFREAAHESKWQNSFETSQATSKSEIGDLPTDDASISKGRSAELRSRERSDGELLQAETFQPTEVTAILQSADKLNQERRTRISSWKQILGRESHDQAAGSDREDSGSELNGNGHKGPTSSSLRQAELPSAGSINHAAGTCSPCSFFRRGTCLYGQNCMYCHCEHEKQRRQGKKMRAAQKRRQAQLNGRSEVSSNGDGGGDELDTEDDDASSRQDDAASRQGNDGIERVERILPKTMLSL